MRVMRALVAIWLVFAPMAGCGLLGATDGAVSPQAPPTSEPSIRGTITAVTTGVEGLGTILIEADPQARAGSPKASTRVVPETRIWLPDGRRGIFADLREGQLVAAWFSGPVAESYPLQATASDVVIER